MVASWKWLHLARGLRHVRDLAFEFRARAALEPELGPEYSRQNRTEYGLANRHQNSNSCFVLGERVGGRREDEVSDWLLPFLVSRIRIQKDTTSSGKGPLR